jgi:murein DD-endopeptidase MepM/ murein hydrolase activator NlpD
MYLWYMKKVINEAVFSSPLDNTSVNSKFGPRWGRSHNGVDLAANAANVKSPLDGVVDVGEIRNDSCGGTIIITHPDGFKTGYCHMQKINVRPGQKVRKGDIIGVSGGGANDPGRGRSDGRHLHFTLRKDGKLVDPMQYIDKVNVSSSDISFSGATPSKDGDGKTNWDDFFNKDTSKLLDKVASPKKTSDSLLSKILKPLEDALNLKTEMMESLPILSEEYSLPDAYPHSSYEYIVRKGRDLRSPESGLVTFVGNDSTCRNTIIVRHELDGKKFSTQFCDVEFPKVKNNERVSKGQKLGSSSSNITVTVFDKSKTKVKFRDVESIGLEPKDKNKIKTKTEKRYESPKKRTSDPLLSLLTKPLDVLNFDNVKTSSEVDQVPEYKWVDWLKKNVTTTSKNESINRNIDKIKKLL